ncbi:energy transducer TonB [Marinicella sp. W31]|uniref:energy transducer TonB n=1 Tax=Marinicella sp. W31 TaxID=3023713 RepID=UPI003756EC2F
MLLGFIRPTIIILMLNIYLTCKAEDACHREAIQSYQLATQIPRSMLIGNDVIKAWLDAELEIDSEGRVIGHKILSFHPSEEFKNTTIRNFERLRFIPRLHNCKSAPSVVQYRQDILFDPQDDYGQYADAIKWNIQLSQDHQPSEGSSDSKEFILYIIKSEDQNRHQLIEIDHPSTTKTTYQITTHKIPAGHLSTPLRMKQHNFGLLKNNTKISFQEYLAAHRYFQSEVYNPYQISIPDNLEQLNHHITTQQYDAIKQYTFTRPKNSAPNLNLNSEIFNNYLGELNHIGFQGTLTLTTQVETSGRLTHIKILTPTNNPRLNQIIQNSLTNTHITPAYQNHTPKKTQTQFQITFYK